MPPKTMVSVRTAACDQLFQICPGVRGELHGVGSSTFFSPGLPRGNLMFDLPIGQHSSLPALVAEGDESGDERRGNARVCRNVLARIIHDFQKRWSQAVAVSRLTQSRQPRQCERTNPFLLILHGPLNCDKPLPCLGMRGIPQG